MELKRTKFTARVCGVLSLVAIAHPAWAIDRPVNKLAISAPAAKTSLRRATLGKSKQLAALRTAKLANLNNRNRAQRPTLVQQALAIASTARDGKTGSEANSLLDERTSWRSRFTSSSMKDAISKLRDAAGFR